MKKSYVETIAGQWNRLNIETVEEAMRITEKEHKKNKKMLNKDKVKNVNSRIKVKNNDTPVWFNKEIQKEDVTEEESEELAKILEELV